jgi:hypothetical protein
MVLTNPPFCRKSSFTVLGADGRTERETQTYQRDDFWIELMRRDRAYLDIFWLKDKSLEGSEDLQPLEIIAAEIAENLEAALEQFTEIHAELAEQSSARDEMSLIIGYCRLGWSH